MKTNEKDYMKSKDHLIEESCKAGYWAWGAVALFFFYQYILRVSPGVMIHEIRQDFGLTAEQFATLGAYYLYAYALLQIPLGIIIDRVGVRLTVLVSIQLCIGGAVLMATTETFWVAQLARVLIGAGSASAFMGALKVVADKMPHGKRGFLMGATLTLGVVGALFAGKPQVLLANEWGWRNVMLGVACMGVIFLLLVFIFVPKPRKRVEAFKPHSIASIGTSLFEVLKNYRVMLYAFLAVGLYTPLSALADLWGPAFVRSKFFLSEADAAQASMMMYLGLGIGSLVLPWLSEKYRILDRSIQVCGIGILVSFSFILFGGVISGVALSLMFIFLGIFCGAEMMCFTGAVTATTSSNSGVTLGVVNTMNMLGGAVLQQLVGTYLDLQWSGAYTEMGIRSYTTVEYVKSLTLLLVVVAVCSLASLGLNHFRRKYGKL